MSPAREGQVGNAVVTVVPLPVPHGHWSRLANYEPSTCSGFRNAVDMSVFSLVPVILVFYRVASP